MNVREFIVEWEARCNDLPREATDNEHALILRALRLLAAAESNDGTTPETDAAFEDAFPNTMEVCKLLERERNGLAARVGELEKDAERYRWLRSNTPDYRGLVAVIDLKSNVDAWLYGEYLDAAIDAARSKP